MKTREKQPIDQRMYEEPPDIPETMKDQHEKLVQKGLMNESKEQENSATNENILPKPTLNISKRTQTWNLDE